LWGVIGKLAVLIGLLWAAVSLVDRISRPAVELVLTVETVPYVLPADLQPWLASIVAFGRLPDGYPGVDPLEFGDDSKQRCFNAIRPDLQSHLALRFGAMIDALGGHTPWLTYLHAKNEGETTAANVSVRIPDFTETLVVRTRVGGTQTLKPAEYIELGHLRPNEDADLFAWTLSDPGLARESARILYDNGVGQVLVAATYRGVLGVVIHHWDLVPAVFLVLLAALLLLPQIRSARAEKKEAQEAVEPAENAKEATDQDDQGE
jgi:hypothetical protein